MNSYPSTYKDQPAISIESDTIRAQFLPGIGAKLCSLVYRPQGFELMVQKTGDAYSLQPYDGDYVSGECSGFDDMFPTIDACFYERYPWQGVRIPDHGELWSIAWNHLVEGDRLHFETYGVRFPYKIEKWVRFNGENTLRIDYRLTNQSGFDFDFVWAAHTMINLEEDVELVLPPGVTQVACTFGSLGRYGQVLPWPKFMRADGTEHDLRWLRPKAAKDAFKYFVQGKMPAGWCALKYPHRKLELVLKFPVEQVPYLGILPNEGGWKDLYNIFLEPATASFDRPDVARLRGEGSVLKAHATYSWHLEFMLDSLVSPGTA